MGIAGISRSGWFAKARDMADPVTYEHYRSWCASIGVKPARPQEYQLTVVRKVSGHWGAIRKLGMGVQQ